MTTLKLNPDAGRIILLALAVTWGSAIPGSAAAGVRPIMPSDAARATAARWPENRNC